jgi:2-(1,2-epoxy-1,2-dihydrophenyl)acetyl-CoA isomerase
MPDTVRYELAEQVATITMNRPDAMNALTTEMKEQLVETLTRAAGDQQARAVILTGAGRAFCVGQDLREHARSLDAGDLTLADTVQRHYNPIVLSITRMSKPVIAAVNGTAAGAGASFAFACDFRLAADNASFATAFSRIGLVPDSGSSWTLQRLVGYGRATALMLLAEPVTASQALEMGLVNAVVPAANLAATAHELAARLAAGPTVAYGLTKQALDFAASHGLAEALEREAELQAAAGRTEDHRSATRAFLAKEAPRFAGR